MSSEKLKIFLFILNIYFYGFCVGNSREKRYLLVFPFGGTFKMVFGIGIPIQIGTKQSLSYGLNFQFQYPLARNITQLQLDFPPALSRKFNKRELWTEDRGLLYRGLERTLEGHGIEGNSCLCRCICENAKETFYHPDNGLYGHLLHILLTPDYGDNETDSGLGSTYIEAAQAGRQGLNCEKIYSRCEQNIIDIISLLRYF